MGLFSGVKKFVKNVGGAVKDVGNAVEDLSKNDLVRKAALVAGAYYGGSYLMSASSAGAAGAAGASATGAGGVYGTGISAANAGAGVAGTVGSVGAAGAGAATQGGFMAVAKQVGTQFASGMATNMALGMAGGGGGLEMPTMPSLSMPQTAFSQLPAATRVNLALDSRVSSSLAKIANARVGTIASTVSAINSYSPGSATIKLGSSNLGEIDSGIS